MLRIVTALGLLLLTSCTVSVEPVITEATSTFDSRLVGSWATDKEKAVVSRLAGNTYSIEYTEENDKSIRVRARLGRLGERFVLDVWPDPREEEVKSPVIDLMVPGHLIIAIEIASDQIRTKGLDTDALIEALRGTPVRVVQTGSGRNDEQYVLVGTSEQLRSALSPYLARLDMTNDSDVWRRK